MVCSIPPAVSRHAEELDLGIARWTHATGLCATPELRAHLAGARFGTLAARSCPEADLDRLELHARWLAFGYFLYEEFLTPRSGAEQERIRRRDAADAVMAMISAYVPGGMPSGMPRSPEARRTYRLDVLAELLADTARQARPDQFSRFGTKLMLCLSRHSGDCAPEPGHTPVSPYLTLAEVAARCPVRPEHLAEPDLLRLTRLAAERTTWCEMVHITVLHGDARPLVARLPPMLRHGQGATPQGALDRAGRVHDETARAYGRLEALVTADATPEVLAYLGVLRHWIRGHFDWCREVLGREGHPDHPHVPAGGPGPERAPEPAGAR